MPGDHLQMEEEDIQHMIVNFANYQNEDYKKEFGYLEKNCKFTKIR